MEEVKISPAIIIPVGLGLGLAAAVGIYALARAAQPVGFSLRIENAPPEVVWWIANFAENLWNYDPPADSGALEIEKGWDYPSDPLGCTTLHIQLFDEGHNILLDVYNLGPVNAGKSYVYDCATGELFED